MHVWLVLRGEEHMGYVVVSVFASKELAGDEAERLASRDSYYKDDSEEMLWVDGSNWLRVAEEQVVGAEDKLVEAVRRVAPYVMATVNPIGHRKVDGKPEWLEVHGGRCCSSYEQMKGLLKTAEELSGCKD